MNNNKYALITGASSGIGYEFALRLDSLGYNTIIVARRESKLIELKNKLKNESIIITSDLSNIDSCKELLNKASNYDIDLFINNAGFGDFNLFKDANTSKIIEMVDVNVKALTYLMKGIIDQFIPKNRGLIINVSSIAGFLPGGPYMSVYYATKSYVTSLTRGVAFELKNTNVRVKALTPGPVRTEFNDVANCKFSINSISKEKCVNYAIKKMNKKGIIIAPSLGVRITALFSRFVPTNLLIKICSHAQKKKI